MDDREAGVVEVAPGEQRGCAGHRRSQSTTSATTARSAGLASSTQPARKPETSRPSRRSVSIPTASSQAVVAATTNEERHSRPDGRR